MPGELPPSSVQAAAPRVRWVTLAIILAAGLPLVGLSLLKLSASPSLRLNTCFQDVNGLHPGAKVRLAGVDIGTVRDVRAQPGDKACPGAVEMELRTPYELKIPEDSVASTATAGLLGETYLSIDVSGASGRPIRNGGQLPSRESVKFTAETLDRALKVVDELKRLSDEEKKRNAEAGQTPSERPSPKSSASPVPQ